MLAQIYQLLLKRSIEIISLIENGTIPEDSLGENDYNNLYNILGLISCCNHIDSQTRLQVLEWAFGRLISALRACPQDNKEKMGRIVNTILIVAKCFQNKL